MTCKDCVHYKICKEDIELHHDFYDCLEVDGVEKHCEYFKPKSRFVELPCEVGQTVYFIGKLTQQIVPSKVFSISYNEGGFHLFCANYLIVTVTEQLGKTVFLTKEEAENALSERSK